MKYWTPLLFHFAVLTFSAPAKADLDLSMPFDLIVPRTMSINTAGGISVGGNAFAGWLVATDASIAFPASARTDLAPGTSFTIATSDTPDIAGLTYLLLWPTATTLMPGEAVTAGTSGTNGTQFFSAELLPSEQTVSISDIGLQYTMVISWPTRHFVGSANLDYSFAIGKEVARYSMLLTFVDLPGGTLADITSAQRVSSVLDPNYEPLPLSPPFAVPEPSSVVVLATTAIFGLLYQVLAAVRRPTSSPRSARLSS